MSPDLRTTKRPDASARIRPRFLPLAALSLTLILAPFVGCGDEDGSAEIDVPEEMKTCFPATVAFSGTYTVSSATPPLSVDREAQVDTTADGVTFKVGEDAEDEFEESDNDIDEDWEADLSKVDPNDDCYDVEFTSPGFGPSDACNLTINGQICPGEPCTMSGKWQIRCAGQLRGQGSWGLQDNAE